MHKRRAGDVGSELARGSRSSLPWLGRPAGRLFERAPNALSGNISKSRFAFGCLLKHTVPRNSLVNY